MIVALAASGFSRECSYALFALLRDNVQHHCEGGAPGGRFPAIHAIANCCWSAGDTCVSTGQLRRELELAWATICSVPSQNLAVSRSSRAAFAGEPAPRGEDATLLLRAAPWDVPLDCENALTLADILGPLVIELYELCFRAGDEGSLVVEGPRSGIWNAVVP